jgi:hypothetical protein
MVLSSKKFLFFFMAIVLLLAAITVSINVYVNPYGYYGDKTLGDEKVFNAQIAKYYYLKTLKKKPDTYVLGSSNSMRMKPRSIDSLFGVRSFNYGVYQAGVEDFYCIANVLVNDLKTKPKLMIICTDDWNFGTYGKGSDIVFKGAQNRLAYKWQFSRYLKDFSWTKLEWARLKSGLGYEQLVISKTNLLKAFKTNIFDRPVLNIAGAFYSDGTRKSYANSQGENITDKAEKGNYDVSAYLEKEQIEALKKNKKGSFNGTHEDIKGLQPERLKLLEDLVILLEKNNVKIIFNVMPVQPFYYSLATKYSNYEERIANLIAYLEKLKTGHKNIILVKDNHTIKNFNGLVNHFFDHIHPTSVNSDSMLISIKRKLKRDVI